MAGKNTAVFGIYPNRTSAENAVDALKAADFRNSDISVLLPEGAGTKDFAHEKNTKAPEGATTGAGTGALLGGGLGWLLGIGALAIPGLGPFIAAGPIMAALAGAGVGGAVGGLTGALIGMGIPEYEAKRYDNCGCSITWRAVVNLTDYSTCTWCHSPRAIRAFWLRSHAVSTNSRDRQGQPGSHSQTRGGSAHAALKLAASGICSTDGHILHGLYPANLPLIPGHEYAGVVESVGDGVDGFAPGDRVNATSCVVSVYFSRRGKEHLCKNMTALGVNIPEASLSSAWCRCRRPTKFRESLPLLAHAACGAAGVLSPRCRSGGNHIGRSRCNLRRWTDGRHDSAAHRAPPGARSSGRRESGRRSTCRDLNGREHQCG